MYRMFFIARNNLARKKSDVITLLMLLMLSTVLLYISISVLRGTPGVIDAAAEEATTADFLYVSACPEKDQISAVLENRDETAQIEYSEGVELTAKYHTQDGEEKETVFLIEPIESVGEICKIPDIGDRRKPETILLPYYMKMGDKIAVGDPFYVTLGGTEYAFETGGFVEDALFSTPLNVSVIRCYITRERYDAILAQEPFIRSMCTNIYKLRIEDGISSRKFADQALADLSREVPELADYMNIAVNYETMKVGTAFLSNIGMGILLIFSAVLICIALIIAWCSIKNFIEGNLKNLGILMASGYTRGQLIGNTCMEMLILSACGAGLGLAAGGLLNGTVGTLMALMIGLKWNSNFDLYTAVAVFICVNLTVLGVTLFCGRIYRRIEILEALRGGIGNHNFRKNPVSLERSPLSGPFTLGIKSILCDVRKNAALTGVVAMLGLVCCIGFALFQNFGTDNQRLLEMIGLETGTAIVSGQEIEAVGQEIETWDEVSKVLYYDNRTVNLSMGEEELSVSCDFWKDPAQNEYAALIAGRLPEYDNEIGVTAIAAKQLGAKVGDIIYVEGDCEKKDYMISGIYQQMKQMGLDAVMTMEGAGRINSGTVVNLLYVYTEEDCTFAQLEKKLKDNFQGLDITDSKKNMESVLASVNATMNLLCAVFVLLTVVIVILIIILLVRAKLTREWKQYGVYKALGFTTGELILQIQMSSLPIFFAGSVSGAVLSVYLLNPLVQVCLGMAGIVQSSLEIQVRWLILSVALIMAVAGAVSFLSASRVRKVEPVKMLTEE